MHAPVASTAVYKDEQILEDLKQEERRKKEDVIPLRLFLKPGLPRCCK